jgi:hypothetical protein
MKMEIVKMKYTNTIYMNNEPIADIEYDSIRKVPKLVFNYEIDYNKFEVSFSLEDICDIYRFMCKLDMEKNEA